MSQRQSKIKKLAGLVREAQSFVLTTHKMGDGDGLGAMLALYHALRQMKKKVRAISVDKVAKKYSFLSPQKHIEEARQLNPPLKTTDLALILDTNDYRRVQPFYNELKTQCQKIIYIDHHPILKTGPKPTPLSIVDTSSASTGELAWLLIKELRVQLNQAIAQALYVSIVFDTQRFQFIRNSEMSHKISAELVPYIKNNALIYNQLFGINSIEKRDMMAQAIRQTKYYCQKKVAVLEFKKSLLSKNKLDIEDACDFLDMNLEVSSIRLSVLIVHLSKNKYKISFRSKKGDVSRLAEIFGGGGHKHASGATLHNYTKDPKTEILKAIKARPALTA